MLNSIQSSYSENVFQVSGVSGNKPPQPPSPEDMFKKVDSNQDNQVDKDELAALAAEIMEKTGQTLDVDQIFETYDEDGDGLLSQSELQTAMESQLDKLHGPPPPPPPEGNALQSLFSEADEDGDGTLNKTELETLLSKLEEKTGQTLDLTQLLQANDSDQNSSLSFKEFENMMDAIRPDVQMTNDYQPSGQTLNLVDIKT